MTPRCLALGGWLLAFVLGGCTVSGTDVMTTFGDPSASGTPPTSGTMTNGPDTDPATSTASGDTSMASGDTATSASTNPTSGESSGGTVDEQPPNGMYSECSTDVDCIGLTTCVLVTGSASGGYCSNTNCINPVVECDMNPGATSNATVACVDNTLGAQVCALSCMGGLTCPGGMDCLALGAAMVCA